MVTCCSKITRLEMNPMSSHLGDDDLEGDDEGRGVIEKIMAKNRN